MLNTIPQKGWIEPIFATYTILPEDVRFANESIFRNKVKLAQILINSRTREFSLITAPFYFKKMWPNG